MRAFFFLSQYRFQSLNQPYGFLALLAIITWAGTLASTLAIAKDTPTAEKPTSPAAQQTQPWDENSQAVYDLMLAQFQNANADYQGSVDTLVKYAKEAKEPGLFATAYRATLRTERYAQAVEVAKAWQAVSQADLKKFEILALALNNQSALAVAEIEQYLEQDDAKTQADQFSQILTSLWYKPGILETVELLHKKYPDETYIQYDLVNLLRWHGHIDQAIAILDHALFKSPRDLDLIQFKSDVYRYSLRVDEAHGVWTALLKDYPNDPQFQFAYAQFLYDAYDFSAAKSVLTEIKDRTRQTTINQLLMATHIQLDEFDSAEAVIAWDNLEQDQRDQLRYQLGLMLLDKKQYAPAKTQLAHIDEDSLFALDAATAIGQAHYANNIQAGEDWFAQIAETHHLSQYEITQIKAQTLLAIEQPQLALELLNAYLNENPQDQDMRYTRSLVAAENGLQKQAIEDLKLMHTRSPENADVQNALGYTMLSQPNQLDEAMQLIKKALFSQPNSPAVVDSKGWGLYLQGDYDAALPYFRYAYANYTDGEIIGHYILGLYHAGHVALAKQLYDLESQYTPNLKKLAHFAPDFEKTILKSD